MVRLGFVIGTLLPVALLAVNLALGYGGILVTIGLLVWLGGGIPLTPASEDGGQPFLYSGAPPTGSSTHSSIHRASPRRTVDTSPPSSSTLHETRTSSPPFASRS